MSISVAEFNQTKYELIDLEVKYEHLKSAYVSVSIELERVKSQLRLANKFGIDSEPDSINN